MIGYTVCAVGIVVDEAEIIGCPREDLRELAQMIKALRERAGFACLIAVCGYWFGCLAVDKGAIRGEGGRGVDPEYGRIAGSIDLSFSTIALNGILHSVEE